MSTSDFAYQSLLSAIRKRKAKCVDCARPIQEPVTGVKHRKNASGAVEKVCDACFYQELGEAMSNDLPMIAEKLWQSLKQKSQSELPNAGVNTSSHPFIN